MPETSPPMQIIPFEPTYARSEQGIWVIDTSTLPLPDAFRATPPARLLHIIPGGWGGNHTHERQEAFLGFGENLYIAWWNAQGERKDVKMDNGSPRIFVVAPWVGHLIKNRSRNPAVVYEIQTGSDDPVEILTGAESLLA